MTVRIFLILAVLMLFLNGSHAYERTTHEDMSEAAAFSSMLATPETLATLGLSGSINDPKLTFPNSEGKDKTIRLLIRDGANFEDNLLLGTVLRVRHHFYDPLTDRPLTVLSIAIGEKSPDWVLEDFEDFSSQAFSFRHARDYLYKALTLSNEQERKKNFGLTFQTLGHVIHHIQDMAQPQHVRNDIHPSIGAHKSLYEEYTDHHRSEQFFTQHLEPGAYYEVTFAKARSFWHTEQRNPAAGQGLAEFTNTNFVSAGTNFDKKEGEEGYFPSPRPLLGPSEPIPLQRLLQDDGTCPAPCIPSGDLECPPPATTPPLPACTLQGEMVFIATNVHDRYIGGEPEQNDWAATYSVFDQDLEQNNLPPAYTLNRFNFQAAYPYLIPKAVAYGAGIIDYFFRGRLEAHDAGYTENGVQLRVKNAIDPQETPAWKDETLGSGGQLILAFEYMPAGAAPGSAPVVGASQPMTLTEDIKPGHASRGMYSFSLPVIPADATEVKYRLVFRGQLGSENDAVAVGAIEPMSGFVVTPNYIPADGIAGTRLIYRAWGQWRLSEKPGLLAGNIDWKGWYMNGRPAKVLSWHGPRTRYFTEPLAQSRWQREVYQNGELFAIAPNLVLGAAIVEDSAGKEWLVVVCKEGELDVVYRRPNKQSQSAALYHEIFNPEGWLRIGQLNATSLIQSEGGSRATTDELRIPWFFNGNGREAQTLRGWSDHANATEFSIPYRHSRLKIEIDADVTTVTVGNLRNLGGYVNQRTCTGEINVGKSLTASTQGEYIIAVDYRVKAGSSDTEEVLAKVRVEGSETRASQVSEDSNGQPTHVANQTDDQWAEYFIWPEGEIMHFSSDFKRSSEFDYLSGSGNETVSSRYYARQLLYALDLREGIYAHSFWGDDTQSTLSGNNQQGYVLRITETLSEGGEIVAGPRPGIPIYGPTEHITTREVPSSSERLQGAFTCTNGSFTETRYGPLDFSFPSGDNAFLATDTNGNIAASFDYRDFSYSREHFNFLSSGALEQTIPGASPQPRYDPLGVIR